MPRCKFVLGCAFAALFASAQEYRATITGRLTDSQSAVIPGVKIAAIQTSTGAKFDTRSGADGQYSLPFLPPGIYEVVAEAGGFKRYFRDNFTVSAGERIALDTPLELGALSETVNVTAEAPVLTTETATTGQVIGSRQVENMPMNGRTPLVLAQLAMGVVRTPTAPDAAGTEHTILTMVPRSIRRLSHPR